LGPGPGFQIVVLPRPAWWRAGWWSRPCQPRRLVLASETRSSTRTRAEEAWK